MRISEQKIVIVIVLLIIVCVVYVFGRPYFVRSHALPPLPPGYAIAQENGISFAYPVKLHEEFMHVVQNWPPQLSLSDGPRTCPERKDQTGAMSETKRVVIGGREYCVTTQVEGAAGSVFTTYAYVFDLKDRVAMLRFTVQATQCDNYDEPKRSQCKSERDSFDPGGMVDAMVSSMY